MYALRSPLWLHARGSPSASGARRQAVHASPDLWTVLGGESRWRSHGFTLAAYATSRAALCGFSVLLGLPPGSAIALCVMLCAFTGPWPTLAALRGRGCAAEGECYPTEPSSQLRRCALWACARRLQTAVAALHADLLTNGLPVPAADFRLCRLRTSAPAALPSSTCTVKYTGTLHVCRAPHPLSLSLDACHVVPLSTN